MISVQTQDFSVAQLYEQLRDSSVGSIGAVVFFVGLVRDFSQQEKLASLQVECYPGMAERELHKLVEQAKQRAALHEVYLIHRVGLLQPTEQIVFVGVSASHRADAFSACEYLIDQLKNTAPLWKKEIRVDGKQYWITHNTPAREKNRELVAC